MQRNTREEVTGFIGFSPFGAARRSAPRNSVRGRSLASVRWRTRERLSRGHAGVRRAERGVPGRVLARRPAVGRPDLGALGDQAVEKYALTFAAICRSLILSIVSTAAIRAPSLFFTRRRFSSPLASPGPRIMRESTLRSAAITAS